jgi:hypothetical protein
MRSPDPFRGFYLRFEICHLKFRAKRGHEAAVQGYLPSGMVEEKLQREMIASAAQRIKPPQPVTPEQVFDFSFARAASDVLR